MLIRTPLATCMSGGAVVHCSLMTVVLEWTLAVKKACLLWVYNRSMSLSGL